MDLKNVNFLTKFTCIVHIHICDIYFLLFAQGNKFARKSAYQAIKFNSYQAIKFIHFELAEL